MEAKKDTHGNITRLSDVWKEGESVSPSQSASAPDSDPPAQKPPQSDPKPEQSQESQSPTPSSPHHAEPSVSSSELPDQQSSSSSTKEEAKIPFDHVQNSNDIGALLVSEGIISVDQLAVAKESQKNLGENLGSILVKKGFVSQDILAEFILNRLAIDHSDLEKITLDPDMVRLVPVSIAHKYHFMPLSKTDDTLLVAVSDPFGIFYIDEIHFALKFKVKFTFAEAIQIEKALKESYRLIEQRTSGKEQQDDVVVVQYGEKEKGEEAQKLREMASGAQVIAEVNRIIKNAVVEGASDIHIEPMENLVKVRTRIDGVLEERMILQKNMSLPLVSRIKVISEMDIAERRVPQDGRVRLKVAGKQVDLRISTYPTMHGEKVVMRLLGQGDVITLQALGFSPHEQKKFGELIEKPYGILLVTGPTGSGKTTTLYSALQRLNSQDKNIVSIEDPIENEMPGVNQAQVNTKAGMTFATALKSILRQDPDVIMLGEIRDAETADIAVRSAITGHMVFSTLHTNTAVGAITRLGDLGIERFIISSALIGVIAQRLVRKICPHCKQSVKAETNKLDRLGVHFDHDLFVFEGKGCKQCRMTGYSGRMGIFDFVIVNQEIRMAIEKGAKEEEIIALARKEGSKGLRQRGVELVLAGETTVDEVLRVTELD